MEDMYEECRVAVDRHVQDLRRTISHDMGELRAELRNLAESQKLDADRRIDLRAKQVEGICAELSTDAEDLRTALRREAESLLVEQKRRKDLQDIIDGVRSETTCVASDA